MSQKWPLLCKFIYLEGCGFYYGILWVVSKSMHKIIGPKEGYFLPNFRHLW